MNLSNSTGLNAQDFEDLKKIMRNRGFAVAEFLPLEVVDGRVTKLVLKDLTPSDAGALKTANLQLARHLANPS